jgi:hypothetical protein
MLDSSLNQSSTVESRNVSGFSQRDPVTPEISSESSDNQMDCPDLNRAWRGLGGACHPHLYRTSTGNRPPRGGRQLSYRRRLQQHVGRASAEHTSRNQRKSHLGCIRTLIVHAPQMRCNLRVGKATEQDSITLHPALVRCPRRRFVGKCNAKPTENQAIPGLWRVPN